VRDERLTPVRVVNNLTEIQTGHLQKVSILLPLHHPPNLKLQIKHVVLVKVYLVGKLQWKRRLLGPWSKWQDNTKSDVWEMKYEDVNWIHLACERF
jgi:hypothetical protein